MNLKKILAENSIQLEDVQKKAAKELREAQEKKATEAVVKAQGRIQAEIVRACDEIKSHHKIIRKLKRDIKNYDLNKMSQMKKSNFSLWHRVRQILFEGGVRLK